jgi:hypothetical protein
MRDSRDRILTTHVGSLPRPDDLIELNRAFAAGESGDESAREARTASAVAEVARMQREAGIDIPNDGEFGKATEHRINFGAWWSYIYPRWGGLRAGGDMMRAAPRRSEPGRVVLTSFSDRRDRTRVESVARRQITGWEAVDTGRRQSRDQRGRASGPGRRPVDPLRPRRRAGKRARRHRSRPRRTRASGHRVGEIAHPG